MALFERDMNIIAQPVRQADPVHTRSKDGDSPPASVNSPTISKATPPTSQRIFASTKASAARATNSPLSNARTPPRSQPQTKRTPRTRTLATTKAEDRSRGVTRLPGDAKPVKNRANRPSLRIVTSASEQERSASFTSRNIDRMHVLTCRQPSEPRGDQPQTSDMAKPRPADKALPSRPVLSFINGPSPSRHSRSLLDASEKPLAIRLGGADHEWPTLTPRSVSVPVTKSVASVPVSRKPATPRSKSAAGPVRGTTTPSISTSGRKASGIAKKTRDSVASSHVHGSPDAATPAQRTSTVPALPSQGESSDANDQSQADFDNAKYYFPARDASLRASSAGPASIACPISINKRTPTANIAAHDRSPEQASRKHSPSPASFSRPRPGSAARRQSTRPITTRVATAARTVKPQQSASRIPLSDSKKATLVHIKRRRSSASSTPRSGHAPSFGNLRLDAPGSLTILDQGLKRQLRRSNTKESIATDFSSSTQPPDSPNTPGFDRSSANTPEATSGPSSDEEEIMTPVYHSYDLGPTTNAAKPKDSKMDSDYHDAALQLFDNVVDTIDNAPPSSSPYTGPLPTIHSQAVLPSGVYQDNHDGNNHSSFADAKQRLSELYTAQQGRTTAIAGQHKLPPTSSKNSMLELLNEYTDEEQRSSPAGEANSTGQASTHISRTLSLLEGKGAPPKTDVDQETLIEMFGNLKRGGDEPQKTQSFVKNAAVAEKFLAASPAGDFGDILVRNDIEPFSDLGAERTKHYEEKQRFQLEGSASKWSKSTESVHDVALTSHEQPVTLSTHNVKPDAGQDATLGKSSGAHSQWIGYPSKASSKIKELIGPGSRGTISPLEPTRQDSTPAVAQRKPGSVRAARETLRQARGGFAAPTASAESKKKNNKMPTPSTKPVCVEPIVERGRAPSAAKTVTTPKSADSVEAKIPRARSKSRLVLEKINSMFSGKREKKDVPPLPVPTSQSIALSKQASRSRVPPPRSDLRTPPPRFHSALRSASRSTTASGRETPVDSPLKNQAATDSSTQILAASLVRKARREQQPARKERLLTFAKVLNDSLIGAREAQISAERAEQAAKAAQLSYEMTAKSFAMLQRLATSLISPKRP